MSKTAFIATMTMAAVVLALFAVGLAKVFWSTS